ncbi:MAG: hypothetical protein DELT_00589 [Desulfovibrio sp.]
MTDRIKKAFRTFNKRALGSSDDYRLKSILNLAGLDEDEPAAVLAVVIDRMAEDGAALAERVKELEVAVKRLERKRA